MKLKYIEVKTPSESRKVQKKLISLGYRWRGGESFFDICKSEFPVGIILENDRKLTYAHMYYIISDDIFEPFKFFRLSKIREVEI